MGHRYRKYIRNILEIVGNKYKVYISTYRWPPAAAILWALAFILYISLEYVSYILYIFPISIPYTFSETTSEKLPYGAL